MMKLLSVVALSVAALATPALAEETEEVREVKTCVWLRSIDQTHVLDDQTIVFEMLGNKYYKNALPNRCPQLGFERSFSYATSITQLCNVDIIRVLQNFGGRIQPGAACGLGKFEEITKEEFKAMREERKANKKKKKENAES